MTWNEGYAFVLSVSARLSTAQIGGNLIANSFSSHPISTYLLIYQNPTPGHDFSWTWLPLRNHASFDQQEELVAYRGILASRSRQTEIRCGVWDIKCRTESKYKHELNDRIRYQRDIANIKGYQNMTNFLSDYLNSLSGMSSWEKREIKYTQ